MSPPFLAPQQTPPLLILSVLSVFPPQICLSSSSSLPARRQIHRARFLSLFCESCEGNLEGLSGINLKGKCFSLLLFLALSADWVGSPGTCRLLIFTVPTPAQSFCQSSPPKEQKKKNLFHFLRSLGPIRFPLHLWETSSSFVNPPGGTNSQWSDWLLFEDVRAVHLFRWRCTEEILQSSGNFLGKTGGKLPGASMHYSLGVKNSLFC